MSARHAAFTEFFRRLMAAGGAALVFALTVFAASPELHDALHGLTDTAHDESCPVVLFASSASVPLDVISVPLPPVATRELAPLVARELFVSPPRYLRQPERGPPARV